MPVLSAPLFRPLTVVLAFGLVAASGVAQADDMGFGPAPQRGREDAGRGAAAAGRRQDGRALADAVRRVERATGGEVLSAERVPFDGRDVSRIKVVDASGRVRVYMDDPQGVRSRRTRGDDDDND